MKSQKRTWDVLGCLKLVLPWGVNYIDLGFGSWFIVDAQIAQETRYITILVPNQLNSLTLKPKHSL